jgi:Flp pilus assembly protein CpaB
VKANRLPGPLQSLIRAATWHRRLLAAGLAAGSVALVLTALAPTPPTVVNVLAVARDLPAGATLSAQDLRVVGLAPGTVPLGSIRDRNDVVGRVLAAAMRSGEPLTDVRLVGRALTRTLGRDGLVAAPIRIADAGAARLLQPGDVVDVLAASDHDDGALAPVVATAVRVVTVPALEESTSALDSGALIVVATTPATAATLARAAVTSRLSVTIRSS